jgi:hypothetical protein
MPGLTAFLIPPPSRKPPRKCPESRLNHHLGLPLHHHFTDTDATLEGPRTSYSCTHQHPQAARKSLVFVSISRQGRSPCTHALAIHNRAAVGVEHLTGMEPSHAQPERQSAVA